ncbi:TetR family transcriptional regulator [Brevundimonas lutea]|uniref:TetR family transcriptional regulator n=1 Tax=Brevundimonas lutea TaxID=2293980 RepID=UPI0013CEB71D|nr:TetR family transcriptional regulator [Brevundimonas lutea]
MITTQGHRATTLRKIARAAGMSTGAVFANGRDKAAIYADLFGAAPVDPPVRRLALALLAKAAAGAADRPGRRGRDPRDGPEDTRGARRRPRSPLAGESGSADRPREPPGRNKGFLPLSGLNGGVFSERLSSCPVSPAGRGMVSTSRSPWPSSPSSM